MSAPSISGTTSRRLAAILLADVAGYSRLMERDEAGTHRRLAEVRAQIIDPLVVRHHGRAVRSKGDDLLVEFGSAVEALSCAVEIQRQMAEHNRALEATSQLQLRIGINVGDILFDGDDIAGDGVNLAARLQALAEPGGIALSRTVRDQVRQLVGVQLRDAGAHRVKNIARPIRVFHVALDGTSKPRLRVPRRAWIAAGAVLLALVATALLFQLQPWQSPPPPQSIALRPVADQSGTERGAAFAQTLTRQLTETLAQTIRGPVVAQSVLAPLSGAAATDIGRRFGLRYVAEAGVLSVEPRLRVAARLIDTANGRQLWSMTLEASSGTDQAAEVASRLADTLEAEVRTEDLKRPPPGGVNATWLTLRGRALLPTVDSVEGLQRARADFEHALQLQPDYAPALAALAAGLAYEADRLDPKAAEPLLKRAAETSLRALALAPADAEVWRTRAVVLAYRGQHLAALDAIDRALSLNSFDSASHGHRGLILSGLGRLEASIAAYDRALHLNPTADIAGVHLSHRCRSLLLLGRYDDAINSCTRGLAFTPDWPDYMLLAAAYAMKGDEQRAGEARDELMRREPRFTLQWLAPLTQTMNADAVRQREQHLIAGLRRAGVPEGLR